MTKAEAKRLGIVFEGTSGPSGAGDVGPGAVTARPRVRREAKGAYHTRCVECDERFDTVAAEDRHLDETKHARYELELGEIPDDHD